MKTTIDLPKELVFEIKSRALREGITMRDLVIKAVTALLHPTEEVFPGEIISPYHIREGGLPVLPKRRMPEGYVHTNEMTDAIREEIGI